MSFPTFNGAAGEDAQEFLDNLEIACLVIGNDDDATRLRVFPLLMKAKAKTWFNTLLPANKGDWAGLRVLFLAKFGGGGETSKILWGKVCELRQGSLFEYNVYELQFVELWERWIASLRLGEAAPDFLKKDRFVAGLCLPPREKVKGRFPVTWMDVRDIACLKERKIRYHLQQREADQEEEGMALVPPTNASPAHRGQDAKVKVEEEERGKSLPKDKGKAKVEDVDAMPIKRVRQEEVVMSETGERRKPKETRESNSKKKSKPRQKLTIKDFALGESSQPYNLVDDVSVQVGSSISLANMLTHECYEEKIKLASPKVDQGKEVVVLGEVCSPYLDGVYTLKFNKAAIRIAIYNEKGEKLFGMDLVVDRMSQSSYDVLFGKVARKALFADYYPEAVNRFARVMLKPPEDRNVDFIATVS
ncbi:hypothetical protein L7F22_041611 [Adiantum nelumboides]|nr:hypothetical protein [Adiantum nelumboides]